MRLQRVAFLTGLILLISCNEKPANQEKIVSKGFINNILDTSKYAIINSKESASFAFDSSYSSVDLDEQDCIEIKKLLFQGIQEYNSSLKSKNLEYFGIDTMKYHYKMQLIPVLNKKGEKEVWINAFCSEEVMPMHWKTESIFVKDGGNCFFNLKINLTKQKIYYIHVNGYA